MSVAFDITFPTATHLYGLPEHATSFRLRGTHGKSAEDKDQYQDPYRLYNLDVFEFELNEPMSLYGGIPYMVAHSKSWTGGVMFLNAAEMWVDVEIVGEDGGRAAKVKKLLNKIQNNWLAKPIGFFKQYLPESLGSLLPDAQAPEDTAQPPPPPPPPTTSGSQTPHARTHWIAETGLLDVFFFPGSASLTSSAAARDPFRALHSQYARLTGTSVLPPIFSTAYHQCRWNYMDEEDVRNVDQGFDREDIPMDVLWLDIEHTDGKRYFTWDSHKFPNSTNMINSLSARGRKVRWLCFVEIVKNSC
jgi:alpha 1,3-glucosidase